MTHTKPPVGIMLVNFGVPADMSEKEVARFINDYMADGRALGSLRVGLHRVAKPASRQTTISESMARFEGLCDENGEMQYLKVSERLRHLITSELLKLGIDNVRVAMTYLYGANPSMKQCFDAMERLGCSKILVMPLYPQSSYAFTAPVHDEYSRAQRGFKSNMECRFVDNFYDDPGYIAAVTQKINDTCDVHFEDTKIVFAFRTIPTRDVQHGDTYELQTSATALAIAQNLGLERKRWTIAYIPYNHLGKFPMLEPNIDEVVERFAIGKVGRVVVVCPGQVIDSVDTLYEIDERMRQRFTRKLGGGSRKCSFTYVHAIGDSPRFARALANILSDNLEGWESDCMSEQTSCKLRAARVDKNEGPVPVVKHAEVHHSKKNVDLDDDAVVAQALAALDDEELQQAQLRGQSTSTGLTEGTD